MVCPTCGVPTVPFGGEDICLGHDDDDGASGPIVDQDDELESAPTERAPAPAFPLAAARASLTELALRAGIAVTP